MLIMNKLMFFDYITDPLSLTGQGSNSLGWKVFVCLLVYAIATVFQLYHGSDMMYAMRKRKPEPTLLPTQGIFNVPQHGMRGTSLC